MIIQALKYRVISVIINTTHYSMLFYFTYK